LLFYTHELAEAGYLKKGMSQDEAHWKVLTDYGLDVNSQDKLYTQEALIAFEKQLRREQ